MELYNNFFYTKNSELSIDEGKKTHVLEELKELKNFKTEKVVRNFLKEKFGIKDDIENFTIVSGVTLSVGRGSKYFNVTYVYSENEENYIKSYNYKLEERSIAW